MFSQSEFFLAGQCLPDGNSSAINKIHLVTRHQRSYNKENKMDLETVWYEVSPYVYTLSGLCVVAMADANMGRYSGALLLAAAVTIIRLRWVHRRKN
jgi:hypothetical protein